MLDFVNKTIWAGGIYPGWDAKRNPQLTVVFKTTYEFDESGVLLPASEQSGMVETDEYAGEPLQSSLKATNEICAFKKGGEFYLYGTAYPEHDNLIAMEVGVGILFTDGKEWKKVLRIFGKRKWNKTMINHQVDQQAGYVVETPIAYENAFGGRNVNGDEDEYPANPVGIGYNSDQRSLYCDDLPLIEIGPKFMTSPMQKPVPAGYGPLPVWWEPRSGEIGSPVDDPVEQGGCPYGKNAKDSLHNAAPLDQRFERPFQGGEVFHLRALVKGVAHHKSIQLVLPELRPRLYTIIEQRTELLSPVCDTVMIDTDKKNLTMIFRAAIPWRLTDRRLGWVVLEDLDFIELPYDKESKVAPRMAS